MTTTSFGALLYVYTGTLPGIQYADIIRNKALRREMAGGYRLNI